LAPATEIRSLNGIHLQVGVIPLLFNYFSQGFRK
jgi:hypothetical protein